MTEPGIALHHRAEAGAVVVSPVGQLGLATYAPLRDYLLKCAVEQPTAIVVDLTGLRVPAASSLVLFSSVAAQLSPWPEVPIRLVASAAAVPGGAPLRRFVAVDATIAEALSAVGAPPVRRVARLGLPNDFDALRACRAFIARACREWGVAALAPDAVLVGNELVENTLRHTLSAPHVRVELRRDLLTVAVEDSSPRRPRFHEPDGCGRPRRGLLIVAGVSASWGCAPTLRGGKVVWAVLRAQPKSESPQ